MPIAERRNPSLPPSQFLDGLFRPELATLPLDQSALPEQMRLSERFPQVFQALFFCRVRRSGVGQAVHKTAPRLNCQDKDANLGCDAGKDRGRVTQPIVLGSDRIELRAGRRKSSHRRTRVYCQLRAQRSDCQRQAAGNGLAEGTSIWTILLVLALL